MKLAEWHRVSGVDPQTAYRGFAKASCRSPSGRVLSGMILVDALGGPSSGRTVLYGRVSAHNQRADLDRQLARLTAWVTGHGVVAAEVVTKVGPGSNGKRPPDAVSGRGA